MEEGFTGFNHESEQAAGVFVAEGVAKAVTVVFDAVEKVFDDFVEVDEFAGALEMLVETDFFAVLVAGFLDGLGVEVRPLAGGGFGDAEVLGDGAMGSAGGADADVGIDHLLVVFHGVVSFYF